VTIEGGQGEEAQWRENGHDSHGRLAFARQDEDHYRALFVDGGTGFLKPDSSPDPAYAAVVSPRLFRQFDECFRTFVKASSPLYLSAYVAGPCSYASGGDVWDGYGTITIDAQTLRLSLEVIRGDFAHYIGEVWSGEVWPPPPPAPAARESEVKLFNEGMRDALFDLDKSDLRPDAQGALNADADFLKAHPEFNVQIEGHCDERGSEEYNLGLGERRANAARSYLVNLSVEPDRIETISYGKDRPVCIEQTEECWQRNRRAHPALP
jgi:peptidoglycan-associated lipoprotein